MDLNKIKRYLKEYQKLYNTHNKTVGSVIKHYRKKRNLTLEETSDDICSISYLCKVEKNQLVPSDTILPKLLKKLDVEEEELEYKFNYEWIDEILKEGKVNEEVHELASSLSDYQSKIIMFAYETLNNHNFDKSHSFYLDLTQYLEYFKFEELSFFLYIIMFNLYYKGRYIDCLNIYKELEDLENNETIILYAKVIIVKVLYRLGRSEDVKKITETLFQELVYIDRFDILIALKTYELADLAKYENKEILQNKINLLNKDSNFNFNYIWFCYYYFNEKNFEKAYYEIKKIHKDTDHFYIMYLMTLDKLKKKKEIEVNIFNPPIKFTFTSYEIIQNYLKIKYFSTNKLKFIKENLLYNKNVTEEVVIANYLYTESLNILKARHQYKDGVELLEKQTKYLNNLIDLSII